MSRTTINCTVTTRNHYRNFGKYILSISFILGYLSDLATPYQMLPALGKDFVLGFEQGVYLKKDTKRMEEEFGCP